MKLGILKESINENRVSITPDTLDSFQQLGFQIMMEKGAGERASFTDKDYEKCKVEILERKFLFQEAQILTGIHAIPVEEVASLNSEHFFVGTLLPLSQPKVIQALANSKAKLFSMDVIPRITRAQTMDVLSSQATVAGYKAVLLAAFEYGRFFPMLTTAAGTIAPARVLILGAGVAGLQAIATSRRLGAVVDVFDTRPEVKEQCMSLGAKFVEIEGAVTSISSGGYAVEQGEDYQRRQKEAIAKFAEKADIIITTALIPGKRAPILITKEMIEKMRPGSVVIDLAAINGGNCELTQNEGVVVHNGVKILGESSLPSKQPIDASRMYSKNILNFLKLFFDKEKRFHLNMEDEIINTCLIADKGEIRHAPTLKLL